MGERGGLFHLLASVDGFDLLCLHGFDEFDHGDLPDSENETASIQGGSASKQF